MSATRQRVEAERWSLPGDCEFPQIREILDSRRLARKLRERLGAVGSSSVRIEGCSIEQFHYKHPVGFRFLCRAQLERGGERSEQTFFGRLSVKPRRRTSSMDALVAPAFGPPYFTIPEWGVELWAFPNDPGLPGLAFLHDDRRVLDAIGAQAARLGLSGAPSRPVRMRVKHVAGKRCGVLYRFDVRSARGRARASSIYAKAYRRADGERAFRLMSRLWECAARRRGDFLLPRPHGFDRENGVVWQEAIPGLPLAKADRGGSALAHAAPEIGARLAGLHGASLRIPETMGFATQVAWLRRARRALDALYPDQTRWCAPVVDKLLAASRHLERGPSTVIHGSFKPSHVLDSDRGAVFIDFDGVCLGDPAIDLGRFIAQVHKMTLGGKLPPAAADRVLAGFRDSYARTARRSVSPDRIDWSVACQLMGGLMDKSVKRMNPRSAREVARLAERLCPGPGGKS
jgi:aminoglycoside phosphotransferase (APT) family kinase protein